MSGSVLKEILSKIYTEVRRIIDNGVSDIILYGSYARGDFDEVVISITCIPLSDFAEYKEVLPYYRNIDSEGVRIAA